MKRIKINLTGSFVIVSRSLHSISEKKSYMVLKKLKISLKYYKES